MTLFVTGVAILALLVASYSQRGAWLACCSTTMSMVALLGLLLIPTVDDPGKVRAALTGFVGQLSLLLDQQTLDALTTALTQGSTLAICGGKNGPGCATAAGHPVSPIAYDSNVPPRAVASEPNRAGATVNGLAAKRSVEDESGPVIWLFDEPSARSGVASRFLIGGINVSGVPLKKVHATLKLDATKREVALSLNVPKSKLNNDAIPAGARFTLGVEIPEIDKKQAGGAIFAFRYTYAGQQRATIWYFTPTMIARLGTPG